MLRATYNLKYLDYWGAVLLICLLLQINLTLVFHFKVLSFLGSNHNLDAKKLKYNLVEKSYNAVMIALKEKDEHLKMNIVLKLSLDKPFKLKDLGTRTEAELSTYFKIVDLLVKENILCSLDDETYRFHSTLVENYFQEHIKN
jgi:hypothetical protein